MSKLKIIDKGAGRFVINGDLTFSTIDKKTLKSTNFLMSSKEITVDLGQVALTDSAGLALMIEWLKSARAQRTHLRFQNVPKQLLTLAKLSGFDKTGLFDVRSD